MDESHFLFENSMQAMHALISNILLDVTTQKSSKPHECGKHFIKMSPMPKMIYIFENMKIKFHLPNFYVEFELY